MQRITTERTLPPFDSAEAWEKYFREMPERVLQAVRICSESSEMLPPAAKEGMEAFSNCSFSLPADAVREELSRILLSPHPEYIRLLEEGKVLWRIFPELSVTFSMRQKNPHHIYTVGEHILHTVMGVRDLRILRWAALLHDLGKVRTHTVDMHGIDHFHGHEEVSARIAEGILSRWQFPKEEQAEIVTLVRCHDIRPTSEELPNWVKKLGKEQFLLLMELKEADALAQSEYMREQKIGNIQAMRKIADAFRNEETT